MRKIRLLRRFSPPGHGLTLFATALFFAIPAPAQTPVMRLVKDINPGSESSDPTAFVRLGMNIYFRANDGVHGFELWRTDA